MRTERRPSQGPRRVLRRRRTAVAGLALAGLLAVPAVSALPAGAQSIEDKRAEAAQVADQLAQLNTRLMDLNAQAEAASYELAKAEEKVAEAQARVDQTNAELDQRRAEVRSFAVDAYKSGDGSEELNALLTADADTAPAKKSYIAVTNGNRQDLIDGLSAAQRQAEDETTRLQQAQAEAERHSGEIDATRDAVAETQDEVEATNARVQGELAELVRQEQERRAEEARRAQEAAAAQARQREAAAAAQAASAAPAGGGGGGGAARTPAPTSGGGGGGGGAPAPGPSAPPPPPPSGSAVETAISAAMSRVGIGDYVWGASGPVDFDCSGLVMWAYRQAGISLPHYSGAQWNATTRISRSQLQRGDLVFWGGGGSEHVAIYLGGNQLVHAFGSGGGVAVTALDGWWKPPTGFGRI